MTPAIQFKTRLLSFVFLVTLFLIGCASHPDYPPLSESDLSGSFDCPDNFDLDSKNYHLLRTNRDGLLIDPMAKSESMSVALRPLDGVKKMALILCRAEDTAKKNNWDTVNVLVYVHGGLNTFHSPEKRIKKASQIISDQQFPVHLAWPSGALTTWSEHLLRVREGKKTNVVTGAITAPFVLVSDILTSIGNFPSTTMYQIANEKDRAASKIYSNWLSNSWKDAHLVFCDELEQPYESCNKIINTKNEIQANYSYYYGTTGNTLLRGSSQLLTLPIRYTAGSLWHSGISSAAWANMKRRAVNITYPTHEFDTRYISGVNTGIFFKLLLKRADFYSKKHNKDYAITLMGHSMGSIVINNVLERYQTDWASTAFLKNIVYMAGAATIGDTLNALKPVLVERPINNSGVKRFTPNFYNLTLNRVAEVSEMHYGGVIPTGSLLVSIDQHHDKPDHPLNRTIGSETNVLSSIKIIDEALATSKGVKVFKSFDRLLGEKPSKHGDFGDLPYWKPETWQIATKQ
ncbi:hypothetical protein ACSV5M_13620 [Cellvibrio sp. ARAG 10.3]|uniref:hypothetical protein n=1 Tax=Cellvibrio sp. ARAG 10.3 TaxID=3451358 RepID=UPI003F48AD0D